MFSFKYYVHMNDDKNVTVKKIASGFECCMQGSLKSIKQVPLNSFCKHSG